jgi:hypothetical protein
VTLKQVQTRKVTLAKNGAVKANTIGELVTFCEENELCADSPPDKYGVLPGWVVENGEGDVGQTVNLTFTTLRLMLQLKQKMEGRLPRRASIDNTYKLLASNMPVSIFGTVDGNMAYKDVSVTIVTSETNEAFTTTLHNHKDFCEQLGFQLELECATPDNNKAIHRALTEVFPGIIVAVCYTHATRKAVEKKSLVKKPANFDKLMNGIKIISSLTDNEVRDHAISLWQKEWGKK